MESGTNALEMEAHKKAKRDTERQGEKGTHRHYNTHTASRCSKETRERHTHLSVRGESWQHRTKHVRPSPSSTGMYTAGTRDVIEPLPAARRTRNDTNESRNGGGREQLARRKRLDPDDTTQQYLRVTPQNNNTTERHNRTDDSGNTSARVCMRCGTETLHECDRWKKRTFKAKHFDIYSVEASQEMTTSCSVIIQR